MVLFSNTCILPSESLSYERSGQFCGAVLIKVKLFKVSIYIPFVGFSISPSDSEIVFSIREMDIDTVSFANCLIDGKVKLIPPAKSLTNKVLFQLEGYFILIPRAGFS